MENSIEDKTCLRKDPNFFHVWVKTGQVYLDQVKSLSQDRLSQDGADQIKLWQVKPSWDWSSQTDQDGNFLDPKSFWTQNFADPIFCYTKILLDQKLFFFRTQKYLDQKVFGSNFFLHEIVLDPILLPLKFKLFLINLDIYFQEISIVTKFHMYL